MIDLGQHYENLAAAEECRKTLGVQKNQSIPEEILRLQNRTRDLRNEILRVKSILSGERPYGTNYSRGYAEELRF